MKKPAQGQTSRRELPQMPTQMMHYFNQVPIWLDRAEEGDNIILSTRIRLARNLNKIPFPRQAKREQLKEVVRSVKTAINRNQLCKAMAVFQKDELTAIFKKAFVERRIISPAFSESDTIGMVAIDPDEQLGLMVNEEDHLRIQAVQAGLSLHEAWRQISRIDDELSENLEFAYMPEFGYLTSCPTNTGTGMRASILIHLPALSMADEIDATIKKLSPNEIAVRGFYGEGTDVVGNIFQISNQLTLGRTETALINRLEVVADKFSEMEQEARERLLTEQRDEIEDRIHRSMAIMKSARLMSSEEFMKYISMLLLGVDLEILPGISSLELKKLMIFTQPAHMQIMYKSSSDSQSRDVLRAQIVRQKINSFS
ncbi:MAG: protein arginine kinase [Calditrichaeota bacterium]|nr:MAG: protein arginine kinase [Calditrichota bacterium]